MDGGFTAFGPSHLAAFVVLLVGGATLIALGRWARRRDAAEAVPRRADAGPGPAGRDRRARGIARGLAVAIVVATVPLQVLYQTGDYWDLQRTLPLQLCDVASVVAAYALWTRRPWAVALTYFWGLTLTIQAVVTPDLAKDFPDPAFLLFWAMHLLTVWAAIYLSFGLGLGPDWRGYRTSLALTAAWAASVYVFNLVAGTNYGYVNAKPNSASVLDLLPGWPWYVLAEAAIIALVWALMTWPWVRRSPIHPRHGADGAV